MPSIFSQEWRDCLRAHYAYVVRMGDHGTEKTLRGVMFEAGFGDDEVRELYVLATAHVDDVGADFVPDMQLIEQTAPAPMMIAVDLPEAVEEALRIEDEPELDEDAVIAPEENAADMDEIEDEPPEADPGISQLSLF